MRFLRILVGSGSRSHVLHGIDSIIAFKPAKDRGSNFLNLKAHEDLTTFISTPSILQFWYMSPVVGKVTF